MTRHPRARTTRYLLLISIVALLLLSSINQSFSQHVHKPHDATHQSNRPHDQTINPPANEHEKPSEHSITHTESIEQSTHQSPLSNNDQSINHPVDDQSISHSVDDQSLIHTEIPATFEMNTLQEAVMGAREVMREHTLDGLIDLSHNSINHTDSQSHNLTHHNLHDVEDQISERDQESVNRSIKLFQEAVAALDHSASDSIIDQSIKQLIESAELGNDEADFELGKIYMFGDLVDRDLIIASSHFLRAAQTGHPASQHMLAFMYQLHLVPATNDQSAESSSDHTADHTVNHNIQSIEELNQLDTAKSVLYDYFAAQGGDIGAQLSLGSRFLHGEGVPLSCESAIKYYRTAAERVVSDLPAPPHQSIITIDRARLLEESPKLEDSTEVIQYYQHSADAGNLDAAVALGQLHYYGQRGLPQNMKLATKYFSMAAAAGDATAMTQLGQMHLAGLIGNQTSNESSNQTAFDLLTRAANIGNSQAQVNLGLIHLTGSIEGVEQSYEQALKWFELASLKGNPEAHFQLAVMNFGGLGVKQDLTNAFKLFHLAAMNGHTKALFNVAQMQSSGLGTPASCQEAVIRLKAVAERGTNSHLLGEGHASFWDAEWDASFLLYALAAHEGMETGQANAAYLIDRGYVDLWSNTQANNQSALLSTSLPKRNKHAIAYELYRLSADQMNTDSMRMLGDYAFYGLINATNQSINQSDNQPINPSSSQMSYLLAAQHYTRAGELGSAQSYFNLGYLYHEGLGVPRDLHLAKRYYDMSVKHDPNAYVPATLALTKLHFDVWLDSMKQWWNGSQETDQSVIQSAEGRTDKFEPSSQPMNQPVGEPQRHQPSFLTWLLDLPCWQWNWYDWYESVEDAVLAVSCCSLAVIIYYRAQRM